MIEEYNQKIISGKVLAESIHQALKQKIAAEDFRPRLAVIVVGTLEASQIYVHNKEKAAKEVGIDCVVLRLPETISQQELEKQIISLNNDAGINGILLQQPLPSHLDTQKLVALVSPKKDVDGFGPYNLGLLQMNSSEAVIAATPKGVLKMIQSVCDDLCGKRAVIIGRSTIVGKPLASLLLNQNCTVTVAHSKTQNLSALCQEADILVAACGCARLVKKDWVKAGAIVIDVGINRDAEGKLCGDVDFAGVIEKAAYISPVPQGVGPMTIAMLLENTYLAYVKQKSNEDKK